MPVTRPHTQHTFAIVNLLISFKPKRLWSTLIVSPTIFLSLLLSIHVLIPHSDSFWFAANRIFFSFRGCAYAHGYVSKMLNWIVMIGREVSADGRCAEGIEMEETRFLLCPCAPAPSSGPLRNIFLRIVLPRSTFIPTCRGSGGIYLYGTCTRRTRRTCIRHICKRDTQHYTTH